MDIKIDYWVNTQSVYELCIFFLLFKAHALWTTLDFVTYLWNNISWKYVINILIYISPLIFLYNPPWIAWPSILSYSGHYSYMWGLYESFHNVIHHGVSSDPFKSHNDVSSTVINGTAWYTQHKKLVFFFTMWLQHNS